MPKAPARRERLEPCKVEASLGYIVRCSFTELKQTNKKNKTHYYFSDPIEDSAIEFVIFLFYLLLFTFGEGYPSWIMINKIYFQNVWFAEILKEIAQQADQKRLEES